MQLRISLCFGLLLASELSFSDPVRLAQVSTEVGLPPPAADNGEMPPPKLPKKQAFTKAEIRAECGSYEGKLIAYYDQVFKVESCKRRELIADDDGQNPLMRGQKIIVVEGSTIAKIPLGEPIGQGKKESLSSCAKLEGRYLMTRGDEIYYIEKCKKRLIPDWDTYAEHAKKMGKKGESVLEMSEEKVAAIKTGSDIKSILDDEYKKLLDAEKSVDLLPIDEACKGLNGKFVAYYSKIYKIQKCKKMPVDAEIFGQKNPQYRPQELSSDQWISLPTGKEFKL